jgi:hypothetical protein
MKKLRDKPIVQIAGKRVEQYTLVRAIQGSEHVKELKALIYTKLDFIVMLNGNLEGHKLKLLTEISGKRAFKA